MKWADKIVKNSTQQQSSTVVQFHKRETILFDMIIDVLMHLQTS